MANTVTEKAPEVTDLAGVKKLTTLSRSSIYNLASARKFPKPFKIIGTSRTVWKVSEVQAWLEAHLVRVGSPQAADNSKAGA